MELEGLLVDVFAFLCYNEVGVHGTVFAFGTFGSDTMNNNNADMKRKERNYRGQERGIAIFRMGGTVIGSPSVLQREQR